MAGLNTVSTSGTSGSLRTNYARIGHAAQQIFPHLFQELLAIKVPLSGLLSYASSNAYLSNNLYPNEWLMIHNAQTNGGYVNFDIPLIYKLIRNSQNVSPPSKGWNKGYPASTEITEGDDIERIRHLRNAIAHRGNAKVSDTELKDYFDSFKDIARRLEQHLSKPKDECVKLFTELETCSMDENTEKMYLQRLEMLRKRDEDLYKEFVKVKDKVDKVQHQVDKVECTDYLKRTVETWSKENENFVKTSVVKDILDSLTKYHAFCLTGKSGIGKSATIQHIALCLRDTQGYTIYPCDCPSEIKTYYREGHKQAFVFNDVCGKYTVLQENVEKWIKQNDSINNVIDSGDIKILVTCRSQVFVDSQFQRIKLFVKKGCNLSLDKYPLTTSIKLLIAKVYLPEDVVDCIKSEIDKFEFLPLMFPLYKSLQRERTNVDPKAFFNNPFHIYTEEINKLRESRDIGMFCALFYLVVNNGFIDQSSFEDEEKEEVRKTRKNVFEACGLNRGTPRQRIREQLDCLLGFLVKKSIISPTRAGYTAMHDKVFDFLCFYFGQNLQNAFIRYADTKVIIKRAQLKCNDNSNKKFIMDTEKEITMDTNEDFTILIDEDNETLYFDRIIKDMSLGKLSASDVFLNNQMKKMVYRRKLLNFMQKLEDGIWRKIITLKDMTRSTPICVFCLLGTHLTNLSYFIDDDDEDDDDDDALSQDRYNFIRLFLEKGADVNHESEYGNTALKLACERIDISIVKLLLEKGANVNHEHKHGNTALKIACRLTDISLVKLLLEKGANVNTSYNSGNSPLTIACQEGNITLIKLLIEEGADAHPDVDDFGDTPIIAACNYELYTPDQHQHPLQVLKLLSDEGVNVNTVDRSGNSPLTYACENSDISLVEFLLEKGADVHLDNCHLKQTPITAICNSATYYSEFKCQIVDLLLEKEANVNVVDKSGNSPLTNACRRCDFSLVKFLLNRGADVNLTNAGLHHTPLMAACDLDKSLVNYEMIQLLLDHGVNINAMDKTGNSALAIAYRRCNLKLVIFLHKTSPGCCQCMSLVDTFVKEKQAKSVHDLTQCQQKALICILEEEDRKRGDQSLFEATDIFYDVNAALLFFIQAFILLFLLFIFDLI